MEEKTLGCWNGSFAGKRKKCQAKMRNGSHDLGWPVRAKPKLCQTKLRVDDVNTDNFRLDRHQVLAGALTFPNPALSHVKPNTSCAQQHDAELKGKTIRVCMSGMDSPGSMKLPHLRPPYSAPATRIY
jgi:hypothetical protein